MNGFISIKNLKKHQHYKDRRPPWIKLHAEVLDDYTFSRLPDASKSHLMLLWLLASKLDNKVPNDPEWIGRQIGATEPVDVQLLIQHGFVVLAQDASDTIAECNQSALPEAEGETEAEAKREGEVAAPRVVLPPEAEKFLAMFYEPALTTKQRERYRDIKGQLFDVLDPLHKGVKIRGGQRSRARSSAHLADCLNAVMNDPPPNRDLAIVWLLNKLMDPEKGPSVTEAHKRREESQRNLEERYQRESKNAGVQWAKENPAEYQKIRAEVDATYRGKSGLFVDVARESALIQKTAHACGFPSFDEWVNHPHTLETTAA